MAKKASARRRRKPHNAAVTSFDSFSDLLEIIANAPRKATMDGEEVTITRREAFLRLSVDRALHGNVRELTKVLQMMSKHPKLAAAWRGQRIIFIRGELARC